MHFDRISQAFHHITIAAKGSWRVGLPGTFLQEYGFHSIWDLYVGAHVFSSFLPDIAGMAAIGRLPALYWEGIGEYGREFVAGVDH